MTVADARVRLPWQWLAITGTAIGAAVAWGIGGAFGANSVLSAAPLAVSGGLVGMLMTELAVPGATGGDLRRALLERRTARRYAGRKWMWTWRLTLAAAVSAIAVAGLVGDAGGRSLTIACPGGGSGTIAPWPGWGYGLPLLGILLVGAATTELAIARTVHRPPGAPTAADQQLRASRLHALLRLGVGLALLTLAEVALGAFPELGNVCAGPAQPSWLPLLSGALGSAGVTSAVSAAAALRSVWFRGGRQWS